MFGPPAYIETRLCEESVEVKVFDKDWGQISDPSITVDHESTVVAVGDVKLTVGKDSYEVAICGRIDTRGLLGGGGR